MESKSLKTSRYAPRTPAETLALSRAERVKQEKEKTTRLFSRLRWKAESLLASYHRASGILHLETVHDSSGDSSRFLFTTGMGSVRRLWSVNFVAIH
jgi:hypothetical protein